MFNKRMLRGGRVHGRRGGIVLMSLLVAGASLAIAGSAAADERCDGGAPRPPKVVGGVSIDSNGDGKTDFVAVLLDTDNDAGCRPDAVGLSTNGDGVVDKGERLLRCKPNPIGLGVKTRPVKKGQNKGVIVEIFCCGLPLDPKVKPDYVFIVQDINGDGDTNDPGEIRAP